MNRLAAWRASLLASTLLLAAQSAAAAQVRAADMTRPEGQRSYLIATPEHAYAGPRPLVILLHGHGGSGKQVLGQERIRSPMQVWLDIAEREQLLLIAPDGLPGKDNLPGWNDCRSDSSTNPRADDAGFIAALIERAVTKYHADPARVYVMGMSNGGGMVYRLAAEMPGKLAAFAAVAAPSAGASLCPAPSRPLPALIVHGTEDNIVPFNGGEVGGALLRGRGKTGSAPDAVALWRKLDQLNGAAVETTFPHRSDSGTTATRSLWGADPRQLQVEFIRIEHGGHTEPSLQKPVQWAIRALLGRQNGDFEMAEEAWSFFRDKRASP